MKNMKAAAVTAMIMLALCSCGKEEAEVSSSEAVEQPSVVSSAAAVSEPETGQSSSKPEVKQNKLTAEQKAELEAMLVMTDEEKAIYATFNDEEKKEYERKLKMAKRDFNRSNYESNETAYAIAKSSVDIAKKWFSYTPEERAEEVKPIMVNVPSYEEYIASNPNREHTLGYIEGNRYMWTDQMTCWDTEKLRKEDGMTEEEIKETIQRLTEEGIERRKRQQEEVEKYDTNGDGEVSFEEQMAGDKEFADWYNAQYEKALHQWDEDAGMKAAQESDLPDTRDFIINKQ